MNENTEHYLEHLTNEYARLFSLKEKLFLLREQDHEGMNFTQESELTKTIEEMSNITMITHKIRGNHLWQEQYNMNSQAYTRYINGEIFSQESILTS